MPKSNRSGNTKRKIRNQKKQESALAEETNRVSTSKLEEKENDTCEQSELSTEKNVEDSNAVDGFDVTSTMEEQSMPKKKKKKKKKKERNNDAVVETDGIAVKMEELIDVEDKSTKDETQSEGASATNVHESKMSIFDSEISAEDTKNNSENPCESNISDCSHGAMENTDKKAKSKEKRDQNDEEACAEDENDSEVSSVFGDDLIPKDAVVETDGVAVKMEELIDVEDKSTKDETLSEGASATDVHESKMSNFDSEISAEGLNLNYISDSEEPQEITEQRNFDCFTRLLMGVGADCLRKYFVDIHPNWTNQPTDASALKKGVLKLVNHEKQKFYLGNIEDWDISLLIRVLRFSAVSSTQLKLHPDKGVALCKIQDIRNKVVGHAKNKKINEVDFKLYWKQLKANLMIIGALENEIDSTLTDHTELNNEQYRQLFLEEIYLRKFSEEDSENVDKAKQQNVVNPSEEPTASPWDGWLKFRDHVNSFKSSQTHYILVADSMAQTDLQNFKVLSVVPWKMVLDFNPSSEDDGLYHAFNSQTTLQRMLSPCTPAEIKKTGFSSLPKQIDPKRTQWLFVNGRKEDTDAGKPKSFPAWEQQSVKHISTLFSCCSQAEIFDNQKSITCLLLPISKSSNAFAEVTLKRFAENFSEFDLNFVCIDDSYNKVNVPKDLQMYPLSSQQLKDGVEGLFNVTESSSNYKMPSFHEGVLVPFSTREYVYMSENLVLLYAGCENESINLAGEENDREKDEEEHRRSFLSGNLISFGSLYFNHDAKRAIEKEIEIHMQRLLDQTLKHSVTVRIAHSPGTGGSTIARRVLWNLHNSFPCAFVKLPKLSDFDEDISFIHGLCNRISDLEDKCGIPAVILLDGHRHWRVQSLSSRIVRTLNSRGKRAIILECRHGSMPAKVQPAHSSANIHKVFYVDARLEDSVPDLQEFKLKYNASHSSARRVFHFPLMSMMEEFHDKLEGIISQTLDELDDVEKDIAAFVAFLQLYAGQSTPALLLYEAFKSRLQISAGCRQITYDSIRTCFSGDLLNLMVYENKIKKEGEFFDQYTLQHREVAKLVFEKYLRDTKQRLYKYVTEFLKFGIVCVERFQSLYCDLFLFNKNGQLTLRFSLLIEKLKDFNPKEAAVVLGEAAQRVPDPRVYGHAARFHAKMKHPNFKKAKDLISSGLILSESRGKTRSIQDSKGVVLSIELKHNIRTKKVTSIQQLETLAENAISAFKLARDFPPSFYAPLIGEVEVWLSCIEWIISRYFSGDTQKAVKFLTTQAPPFFRTCIGDCFNLLDIVDDIVMSSTNLPNPDESREHAQKVRINLISAIKVRSNHQTSNPVRDVNEFIHEIVGSKKNLAPISQKEVKRLKARLFLSLFRREPQCFKPSDVKNLVNLLHEMVLIEKEYSFARHFFQLCPQIGHPGSYSLEQGWEVCCEWLQVSDYHDPMRYYYSIVIAFMEILNGRGPSGFFAKYKSCIRKLREASRAHHKRNLSLHFLGKNGDGMSKLVSYTSLFSGEAGYRADDSKVVRSFWTVESRRKLMECTGRLRVRVQGNREVTTIELLQGDIELYVGKSADIGKPGKDFDKDAKVYFVVSFNLTGPIANGITFHPVEETTDA